MQKKIRNNKKHSFFPLVFMYAKSLFEDIFLFIFERTHKYFFIFLVFKNLTLILIILYIEYFLRETNILILIPLFFIFTLKSLGISHRSRTKIFSIVFMIPWKTILAFHEKILLTLIHFLCWVWSMLLLLFCNPNWNLSQTTR